MEHVAVGAAVSTKGWQECGGGNELQRVEEIGVPFFQQQFCFKLLNTLGLTVFFKKGKLWFCWNKLCAEVSVVNEQVDDY